MTDTGRNNEKVDWDRLVIFSGVIMSAVLIGLMGISIFAIADHRPGAYLSITIIILCLLAFWVIIWGTLWIISGKREASYTVTGQATLSDRIEELQQQNEDLKKRLAELSPEQQGRDNSG